MSLIKPRTLNGFRDYLPAVMIPRERLMETARGVFRSYGFAPIDTPTLEYLEILTGKGSDETDRQMYRFQDNGGRDVGMSEALELEQRWQGSDQDEHTTSSQGHCLSDRSNQPVSVEAKGSSIRRNPCRRSWRSGYR